MHSCRNSIHMSPFNGAIGRDTRRKHITVLSLGHLFSRAPVEVFFQSPALASTLAVYISSLKWRMSLLAYSQWTLLSHSSIQTHLCAASTAPACPDPSVSLKEIHKFLIVHLTIDKIYYNVTSVLDSL